MRNITILAGLVLFVSMGAYAADEPAGDEMGPVMEFANAGISMAVPTSFEPQQPNQATELFRALNRTGKYGLKSVTLSAFPVPADSKLSLAQYAEKVMDELRGNLAIRHLRKLSETPMPAGELTGLARMISYTYRGEATTTAMFFLVREVNDSDRGIFYQLNVESAHADKDMLLPLFGEIVSSVSFSPPRPAEQIAVDTLHEPIADYRVACSLRPPLKWYATMTPNGLTGGQFDYTRNQIVPKLQLVVRAVDQASTSQSASDSWMVQSKEVAAQAGLSMKLLSSGPATMGENTDAYQFLMLQVPPVAAATTQPEKSPHASVVAQRTLVAVGPDDRKRAYSLVILVPGGDATVAEAMIEKVAEGFALITEYPPELQEAMRRAALQPSPEDSAQTLPAAPAPSAAPIDAPGSPFNEKLPGIGQ